MKPFKTIDEQYDLLVGRGLTFSDEERSKRFLLNYNYYNVINGYAKFFMSEDDHFLDGTTFEEIVNIHYYDKEIKSLFFKNIIEIEKHFKSIVAYRYSEKYKDIRYAYLIASNYDNQELLTVTKTISSISSIINKYKTRRNNAISHYVDRYDDLPLWVLVNYMNFGTILHFYKLLDDSLKNQISKDFSFFLVDNLGISHVQFPSSALISFLDNILDLRNVVAHNNKLLGFSCKGHVHYLSQLHDKYSIANDSEKQNVYNVFIVMQAFLSKEQYAILHNTLLKRTNYLRHKLKTISISKVLDCLGFPSDWYLTPKLEQPSNEK